MNAFAEFDSAQAEPLHAIECEQEVLGAILHNNDAYHLIVSWCGPQHFFEGLHARILEASGKIIAAGGKASLTTVYAALKDDPTLIEMGGAAYIAGLWKNVTTVINAPWQAQHIVNAYKRRESARLTDDLQEAIRGSDNESTTEIRAALAELLNGNLLSSSASGPRKAADIADEVLTKLSNAYSEGHPPRDFAWPGSIELERVMGGWRQGRFYVIAGRPSMGKTTTGLSWLIHSAARGHGVFFVSLEMGETELMEIALCDLAYNRSHRIEYRDISATAVMKPGFDERFQRIHAARARLDAMPFTISDRSGQTVAEIRAAAQQYGRRLEAEGKRLDVICIDHLNLIRGSDRYQGSKTAETEEVSMALKQLAKDLQCAVIALCQLNRAVEGREEKRPSLADLRWSGAIEQDADIVMFVYREAYYLERAKHDDLAKENDRLSRLERARNKLEVVFGKHRGGPCPVLEFYCDLGCGVVRDLDSRQDEDGVRAKLTHSTRRM